MSDRTGSKSALRQVAASRLFLGATIAMFLSGLGASAAAPQIVLFLVKELGASLPLAGFYYLTSLAAPVAGYFVGRYSDHTGNRLGLFRMCAVAGFVGWAGLAVSTSVWIPFIIAVALLAVSGATASQIFAAVHDELSDKPDDANESVVAIIRMALTGGWIVGPVLGAWVAAAYGLRAMLWMTAICMLLQIAPLGTLNPTVKIKPASASEPARHSSLRAMLPLLTFTGLFVMLYAGEPVKYGFLLIYMEERLKLGPAVRGAVIGTQPFIELIIMPFSIGLGRKLGNIWLMCIAAAMGVFANLCFALWSSAAGMFAGQILMGRCLGHIYGSGHHRRSTPASQRGSDGVGNLHELDGPRLGVRRHRERFRGRIPGPSPCLSAASALRGYSSYWTGIDGKHRKLQGVLISGRSLRALHCAVKAVLRRPGLLCGYMTRHAVFASLAPFVSPAR
jgi:SET family sugar efflux transporter-like MFS transporter